MNDLIESVFGESGWLVNNGYSFNPIQRSYAYAIAESLKLGKGGICPIEAETGVGKTLAYLFVVADVATHNNRVVFATHSINLLKQVESEIALVAKYFESVGKPMPLACVRLGREHYVDPDRVYQLVEERLAEEGRKEMSELEQQLVNWASRTIRSGNGLISSFTDEFGALPEWLTESAIGCDNYTPEHVNPEMDRTILLAKTCPIVITTHAMLVNHILTGSLGTLESAVLMIDEADRFEDAADLMLNRRLQINELVKTVNEFKFHLPTRTAKGFDGVLGEIDSLEQSISSLDIGDSSDTHLILLSNIDIESAQAVKEQCRVISKEFEAIGNIKLPVKDDTHAMILQNEIRSLSKYLEYFGRSSINRGIAFSELKRIPSLYTKNVRPAAIIKYLLEQDCTAILTSATLSNSTEHYKKSFSQLASSFLTKEGDFRTNYSFAPTEFGTVDFVLSDAAVGKPYINEQINNRWLKNSASMIKLASDEHERVLVLTNSYHEMERLEGVLVNAQRPVYFLYRKASLTDVISKWADTGGVLVASNLWEGFSLRLNGGQLFTGLVITKLPYSPYDDFELTAMRHAYIEHGKDGQLGEGEYHRKKRFQSSRKFRQGFGRLIRHASDTGTFYIADPRFSLSSKQHDIFVKAIPERFQKALQNESRIFSDGNAEPVKETVWIEGLI